MINRFFSLKIKKMNRFYFLNIFHKNTYYTSVDEQRAHSMKNLCITVPDTATGDCLRPKAAFRDRPKPAR